MQTLMQRILQEVLVDPSVTQISCEPIDLENLLVYIEAELDGRDAASLYPQVRAALDNSLACRQEYEELKAFLRLEQSDQWLEPPRAPRLDFSYLPASVQPPMAHYQPLWYWEKLGHFVVEFSAGLLQMLQPPEPQLAYTFERSNQAEEGGYQFTLKETVEDLNIGIKVLRQRRPGDYYQIIVETDIPSRGGWPDLANTTIHIKQADTVVQTRLTDAFGKVAFDPVEVTQLAQLKVEIIPDQSAGDADSGRQSG